MSQHGQSGELGSELDRNVDMELQQATKPCEGSRSFNLVNPPLVITSAEQACEVVRQARRVSIAGASSKPGLRVQEAEATCLDTRGMSGIIEYEPGEYTFTARAGTAIRDIVAALDKAGQYLPFDPMLIDSGTTLGGSIASGLSGPGRFRYGGLRDFIIGIRFVDGHGRVIHGGGKVVKNAAGFDFPKLMVGSLGRLGLITEATFKVFPKPEASLTAVADAGSLNTASLWVAELARQPFDLDAIEVHPPGRVIIRLTGHHSALLPRLQAIRQTIIAFEESLSFDWHGLLHFSWQPAGTQRLRVPITPHQILKLDQRLDELGVDRRYSVACNAAYIAWPTSMDAHALLTEQGLGGLNLDHPVCRPGLQKSLSTERLIKQALDPQAKFGA